MSTNKQDDKMLESMLSELEKSPPIYHPSNFWIELNKFHKKYLSESGFENFKRTINYHYFSWGVLSIIRHQMSPIFKEVFRGNLSPFLKSHFDNYNIEGEKFRKFNPLTAFIYRIYVTCLFEYVVSIDKLNILNTLEEPLLGNPFVIEYKNRSISQDLCNSIYEFYSIMDNITLPKKTKIADLGAGYGRLGYVFLNAISDSSYCVIDIPPALFISQNYLKAIFPKEKIFLFRPFSSFEDVQQEFESSRIRFLMPHQLELLG